jgi:hydrogenase expression/formation protein HypD
LEAGRAEVENAYPRAVTKAGNRRAQELIAEVFETTDREWRGLGRIPQSGWQLRAAYRHFDAEQRFSLPAGAATVDARCRSGEVLQGLLRPSACPAFGKECTPRTPLGATMVSSEGACAAYFHYGRLQELSLKPQLVGPAS